ncbi:MAG: hypothetical protein ACTIOQ_04270 [Serratia grimesii]|uniref:hypothetical protein n=1 Tax=Serratia grimesii TaxID=82995 RepID=UPI003F9C4DC7
MLDKFKLLEVSTDNISFFHKQFNGIKGGAFTVSVGEVSFDAGKRLKNDAESKLEVLEVTASPRVFGTQPDSKEYSFELKINMRMVYTYPAELSLDESKLQEIAWYFTSMMNVYFGRYADQILQLTTVKGIKFKLN